MIPWWVVLIYCVGSLLLGEAYDHGRKIQNRPFLLWQYLAVLLIWPVFLVGALVTKEER